MSKIEQLKKTPRSLIFLGEELQEMYLCAVELAAAWLGVSVDELLVHPDYLEIEAQDDVIGAERSEIIRTASMRKPLGEKSVCIVRDAQLMTKEMQNKLLKALEDGEKNQAVIFITSKALLDTISSRCMTVRFEKLSLACMSAMPEYKNMSALLASDGSPEMYGRIVEDSEFSTYLEGFHKSVCGIKERSQLKNILRLTHALKEKDPQYLPDMFENWQMHAFLCLLKHIYWHIALKHMGFEVPSFVRIGNLWNLYGRCEADTIYRRVEEAIVRNQKKGDFNKNDFFELLMHMIPLGKEAR